MHKPMELLLELTCKSESELFLQIFLLQNFSRKGIHSCHGIGNHERIQEPILLPSLATYQPLTICEYIYININSPCMVAPEETPGTLVVLDGGSAVVGWEGEGVVALGLTQSHKPLTIEQPARMQRSIVRKGQR